MQRPNILILYTDQQRWDALGVNGNSEIETPHLDRLAAAGVRFDHCFVQNPVCMPSRVSFLTGQYPSTLGLSHMGVPVPADAPTLPRLLRNYGYYSGQIGKLHFLPHANRDHRQPHPAYGFDHLEISDEPGSYHDAYRAWVAAQAPEQLDRISLGEAPSSIEWKRIMNVRDGIAHPEERFVKCALASRCRSELTHTAFVAEQTMEFLTRHRDGPFLCVAGFYSPHDPWVAPQEFLDLYDPATLTLPPFPPALDARRGPQHFSDDELRSARHGYYAMVSEVDHHVGRILDRLDALGIADNTIVVFTSDHGEWLGEHLRYGKGYPGHDAVTRVPLLIRWPSGASAGRCSRIVEALDVVPTLLEAVAIQRPAALQGSSLLPDLRREEGAGPGCAITEMTPVAGRRVHRQLIGAGAGRTITEMTQPERHWKTLRVEGLRYVVDADGSEALFDLERDPLAYQDVAGEGEYATRLQAVRKRLLERLLARERPLPRQWTY